MDTTDVIHNMARKSLYLGSAAALVSHGGDMNRKKRRAEAARKRKAQQRT
nr:hypothetical protein [Neorhizobium tomejilense]